MVIWRRNQRIKCSSQIWFEDNFNWKMCKNYWPPYWCISWRCRRRRRRSRQCSWLLGERDTRTTACTWRGRRREEGKRERCRQLLRGHWGAGSAPSRGASALVPPLCQRRRRAPSTTSSSLAALAGPLLLQPYNPPRPVAYVLRLNCKRALSIDHNYPPRPTHTHTHPQNLFFPLVARS